ncbi:MAG: outer membrane beta-barrel protein [Pseudomonadota bacterium]
MNALSEDASAEVTENQVFQAAYFDIFVPRSAFDMLERVPGFQIVVPNERRGLGQGGANVLLNGERLTGKSGDVIGQLQRLDAKSVLRIEIIDGATSGVPGLSGRVANITTRPPVFSGRWEWVPAFQDGAAPNTTRGSLNISGSSGQWSYTLGLENNGSTFGFRGDERRDLILENDFTTARESYSGREGGPELSAELTYEPSDKITANLEIEYGDINVDEREYSSEFFRNTENLLQQTNFFFGIDRKQGDLRGDIKMPLGPGDIKLISFYSFQDDFRSSVSDVFPIAEDERSSRFEADVLTQEFIFRTEYNIAVSDENSWQAAGEFAHNKLESENAFLSRSGNDSLTQQMLPNPTTDVREDRWDATVTYNRKLSETWDFQAALGAEYSTLTQQTSLGQNEESFFRPKGFGLLTYTPNERLTIAGRIERDVGQLNFFDFVSSINLRENLDQTGNPDLVPQQLWRYEADTAWTAKNDHSLNLTVYAEDVEDVVDRIAVGDGGDAIGNIDSASRYGLDFIGTLKGDPWGWDGVQVDVEFQTQTSSVIDPITGVERQLNGVGNQRWSVEYQHDIPNTDWAYGGKISRSSFAPLFRVRSVDDIELEPFMYVYAEHKDILGLRVRAGLYNFNDFATDLERISFDNRRDLGIVNRIETRSRRSGPYILLNISGTWP